MSKKQSKILFINSPLSDCEFSLSQEDYVPPLGMLEVVNAVKKDGFVATILDAAGKGLSTSKVISAIEECNFDLVGLNIFSTNKKEIIKIINHFSREIKFLVGGAGVNGIGEKLLDIFPPHVVDIIHGDGELITPDIINGTETVAPHMEKNGNRIFEVSSASTYFNMDINSMPIDRSMLPFGGLSLIHGDLEACIIATRGCIYNCAFCGSAISRNRGICSRVRSNDNISFEIDALKSRNPELNSIRFIDDLFLRNKDSVLAAIEIFGNFPGLMWRAMAHINSFKDISEILLNKMKDSGCRELFIGIESGSPRILAKIHKLNKIDTIINVVSKILRAGIDVKGYFMYGFPGENAEDVELTFRLAKQLKQVSQESVSNFRTSVFRFRPYEGTELFEIMNYNLDIKHDDSLSTSLYNRSHFNFKPMINISACDDSVIEEYIVKTMMLN